jgi:hypothetical protein
MHALAFCASLHWQTANSAPKIKETLPARSRKSHAHDLKNQPNNTQEEECCIEAFEEDLRSTKRDFQTGRFTRFSNRRWQRYPATTENMPSGS